MYVYDLICGGSELKVQVTSYHLTNQVTLNLLCLYMKTSRTWSKSCNTSLYEWHSIHDCGTICIWASDEWSVSQTTHNLPRTTLPFVYLRPLLPFQKYGIHNRRVVFELFKYSSQVKKHSSIFPVIPKKRSYSQGCHIHYLQEKHEW